MTKKQAEQSNVIACSIKGAGKDIRNAVRGLKLTLREEHNFRIQTVAAFLVLGAAAYFKLTPVEVAIVVGTIALVMSLETLNSSVERILDASYPRVDPRVGRIKDMAGGAVFIAIVGSVIIGILIFLPYLLELG